MFAIAIAVAVLVTMYLQFSFQLMTCIVPLESSTYRPLPNDLHFTGNINCKMVGTSSHKVMTLMNSYSYLIGYMSVKHHNKGKFK